MFTFVDNQRTGGEVSQALVLLAEEHRYDADCVDTGKLVDDAEKVAGHGFEEADASARALNNTNLYNALARRPAIPKRFKKGEVAPINEEWDGNRNGSGPFFADLAELGEAGIDQGDDDDKGDDDYEPDEVVNQERGKAAAEAGQRHINCHHLRGFNAKLVPIRLPVSTQ